MERLKVNKILYNKYVPMLAIRDGHIDYFINSDRLKLKAGYICYIFYSFED